ncbi:MAG TPA: ADP-glyceromanno-heptose 6-epimerase [Nitrospinaceae bacterium]|nr:ADP-glyceromanno-heptose 6-epimerase [Nitrospinaceae bacterium]
MVVVTGGAGFIGSAIAQALNDRGRTDLIVVDEVDHPEKEKNLISIKYHELRGKDVFLENVLNLDLPSIEAIIHMGACSSTTETNEVFLTENNYDYTRHLAQYALKKDIRFIYASSAATYGNGEMGYRDDESKLHTLKPLNLYGESKQKFDLWAEGQGVLDRIVGLKYFNVFGPNEYHKEDMQSMVRKGFLQARDTNKIRLFKSYRKEYADGGQERDFLYIKDAVKMTLFFLDQQDAGGIFNVGAGRARNWNDLATTVFKAMDREPKIEYIEMPDSIRDQYQYHTSAEMKKIRDAGYTEPITSLEEGITDYIQNYLLPNKRLGE